MNKSKILLVEDDAFLRNIYIDILKEGNFTIDTASDGEEGLAKMQKQDYDLILLDIVMPKLDGIQVLQKATNQSGSKKKFNVVFLTNLNDDKVMAEINKIGVNYLVKSDLNPDEFLNKVKQFLH